MTNKEAKEIMSKVTFYWELGEQTLTQNQINEALDMAIKALEQKAVLDKIRDEIEELKPNNPNFKGYFEQNVALNKVLEIIDKYKTESEEER